MSFWKDNFNVSNFGSTHEDPNVFVTSQWQWDKDSPSIIYLVLRLIIFLVFFSIWILSYTMESEDGQRKWAVYLTNWGLTVCTIQAFLSVLMLSCVLVGKTVLDGTQLIESILKIYKFYWIANVIATSVAFTISFVYWSLIHRPEFWSTMNFMVHGMNSILMFIDFCVVAHPVRLLHFVYPICFTIVYVSMTAIYYVCGGTAKGGDKYIYPILKWDQPLATLGYCVAVVVLITIIHSLTFLLYLGRSKIAEICFGDTEKERPSDASMRMLQQSGA